MALNRVHDRVKNRSRRDYPSVKQTHYVFRVDLRQRASRSYALFQAYVPTLLFLLTLDDPLQQQTLQTSSHPFIWRIWPALD